MSHVFATYVAPAAAPAESEATRRVSPDSSKIMRFARSERILHWCIAGPFLFSMATALVMVFVYNPHPTRPFRLSFSRLHRISGVAMMVLPLLAAFKARGDMRLHFYNIKQAWVWMFDDIK